MIVAASRPAIGIEKPTLAIAKGGATRELATALLRFASACWRGEKCTAVFPLQLNSYWRPETAPAPVATPDAVSPHGAAGRGIEWYQPGEEVRGHVPRLPGAYPVPVEAIPRLVRCAPAA